MESTQKKSSNSRVHRGDRIKQIFALVSMVSFGGSAIFGVVSLFTSGLSSQHQQKSTPVAVSQTALEGLANVRLQMNNKVGAIEPLEKLVKLNPDRADYKALLGQAKGK
jgi:hypothetical protein